MADDLQGEISKVAEKIPGCRYVSLVGYDGITVVQHIVDANFDVSLHDAEVSSILLAAKEVKQSLNLGSERELIWLTDDSFYIIHPIGESFFIYANLKPTNSSPGVARVELNKAKGSIGKLLYPESL